MLHIDDDCFRTIPARLRQQDHSCRVSAGPIPLSVSSRGVGFSVHCTYKYLPIALSLREEGCDTEIEEQVLAKRCSIHSLYRVSLAQFTRKLSMACDYPIHSTGGEFPVRGASNISDSVMQCDNFSTIADVINSVGSFTYDGLRYTPKQYESMPRYMRLNYNNLRDYVRRMSDPETPLEERLDNFKHNPLPGSDWGSDLENPLLQNADEIMPESRDILCSDVSDVACLLSRVCSRSQTHKKYKEKVDFHGEGSKAQIPAIMNLDVGLPSRSSGDQSFAWRITRQVFSTVPLTASVMSQAMNLVVGETLVDKDGRQPPWTTRYVKGAVMTTVEKYVWDATLKNSRQSS